MVSCLLKCPVDYSNTYEDDDNDNGNDHAKIMIMMMNVMSSCVPIVMMMMMNYDDLDGNRWNFRSGVVFP